MRLIRNVWMVLLFPVVLAFGMAACKKDSTPTSPPAPTATPTPIPSATATGTPCTDTIGVTSASNSGTNVEMFFAHPITAATTITVKSLNMPLAEVDNDCQIQMGIYRDDGAGNPVSLVYGSAYQNAVEGNNVVGPLNVVLEPGDYWLCFHAWGGVGGGSTLTDNGSFGMSLDVLSVDFGKYSMVDLGLIPFPDPFPTANIGDTVLSIVNYGVYCP